MPETGLLFTPPNYFRSQRVEIVAEYTKFQLTKAKYEPGKSDAALAKKGFPQGFLPAFESKNTRLFEANAIAHFIANDELKGGSCPQSRAEVVQFENWSSSTIVPPMTAWVFPCLGVIAEDKKQTEAAKECIKAALTFLNEHLKTRTFLVGERITLADIAVSCDLLLLYTHVLDVKFREPFRHVNRWFVTIVNQPQAKKVLGEVKLAEKMATFDGKKYGELHQQQKQQQPKKKEEPKKGKQPPAPKKEEKTEEEEEELAKKKAEQKDPFLKFPAGNFIMDEWKKIYSNNDIKTVALPYFWEKFEPENYSIWFCKYKFPEELRMIFMSCNLVSGMFQRLDRMRKHSFGSMIVFGKDMKAEIQGLWIWRGQELAFPLHDDLMTDYESYDWKKLDPKSPETKKMVEEYFLQEGSFDGKPFNQGKIFK